MRGLPETAFECACEVGFTSLNDRAQVRDAYLRSHMSLDMVSDATDLPTEKPALHRILAGRRWRPVDFPAEQTTRFGNRPKRGVLIRIPFAPSNVEKCRNAPNEAAQGVDAPINEYLPLARE